MPMTTVAAGVAAALLVAMAVFQAALALGAPLGEHVLGGRYSGALPGRARLISAIAAVILVGAAVIVLARAGIIGWPGSGGLLGPAIWIVAGYMVLNTLANLSSKSRLERRVFAAVTATLAVLCAYVALAPALS